MDEKKSDIIRRLQDSRTMQAIKEDVAKSSVFVATTTCMTCKKKIALGQETCPECKTHSSNTFFSIINAFLVVCAIMFLILGFLKSLLWLYSIAALVFFIIINKLRTRIVALLGRIAEGFKRK